MKSRICKIFSTALVAMALVSNFTVPVQAAELPEQPTTPAICSDSEAVPYADSIVIYTRTHNGKRQYRRWNETRGYWVDPDWIDM